MGKFSDLVRALAVALSGQEETEMELGALRGSPLLTEPQPTQPSLPSAYRTKHRPVGEHPIHWSSLEGPEEEHVGVYQEAAKDPKWNHHFWKKANISEGQGWVTELRDLEGGSLASGLEGRGSQQEGIQHSHQVLRPLLCRVQGLSCCHPTQFSSPWWILSPLLCIKTGKLSGLLKVIQDSTWLSLD